MASYVVIPANRAVVDRWGPIYARLKGQLQGGGVNDMWTAACALSQEPPLPIATNNLGDFKRIRSVAPFDLVHPDL